MYELKKKAAIVALGFIALGLCLSACQRPDPPREGTLLRDQSFRHDRIERDYHLYRSAKSGPRPLIVLLHGGGGSIDNHIGLDATRWPHQIWLEIADEQGLHLLVPQGVSRHWNDCRAECMRCGELDDMGFLLALLDELQSREAIDPAQIYVVGESNGGFMAQRLAQQAPERFAGIGVVIALMPANNACEALETPIPIMYQIGSKDAAIPYQGGASDRQSSVLSADDTIAYWRQINACQQEPTTHSYPDRDPEDGTTARREDYSCQKAALSMITMEGAGHVPPSVDVQVSALWEGIVGIQNHDIEGAREFWTFFEASQREP